NPNDFIYITKINIMPVKRTTIQSEEELIFFSKEKSNLPINHFNIECGIIIGKTFYLLKNFSIYENIKTEKLEESFENSLKSFLIGGKKISKQIIKNIFENELKKITSYKD
ncbi:unnamed protein product, partial [marine sediment metagenome]